MILCTRVSALGKAAPYGVYDIAANEGWVSVGIDADTAAFAVESIRRWWWRLGKPRYPNATTLTTYAILGAVIGSALLPAALGGLIGLAGAVALPLGVAACAIASLGMVGVISLRLRS